MFNKKYWRFYLLYAMTFALTLIVSACGNPQTQSTAAEQTQAVEQPQATEQSPATEPPIQATEPAQVAELPQAVESNTTAAASKLNLNSASGDEFLAAIPGFGSRMVREFEEYRPYISIQQFRKEMGKYVDATQIAEYEKYVFVPINRNESDEATLQQISGVTTEISAQLLAARPYASNDDFLKKLAELAPAVDQAVAKGYLTE